MSASNASSARIASVLRIRRLQERRERAEVAARRRTHLSAADAETRAWTAVSDHERSPVSGTAAALVARRAILAGGVGVAQRRGETTLIAAHDVDVQVATWSVAAQRVEGLERLEDKIRTAERAEREQREALELDDLVLARRGRTEVFE